MRRKEERSDEEKGLEKIGEVRRREGRRKE